MNWTPVTDRLIRAGQLWSTQDWQPAPSDYRTIAEHALRTGQAEVRLGVAHEHTRIRIFRVYRTGQDHHGMDFVDTGEFFTPQLDASMLSEWQRELITLIRPHASVSVADVAPYIFPYNFHRGLIRRSPDRDDWTDDPVHPSFEEWDELNAQYRATDSTQTQFQRLRELGLMRSTGYNTWELCKSKLQTVSTRTTPDG